MSKKQKLGHWGFGGFVIFSFVLSLGGCAQNRAKPLSPPKVFDGSNASFEAARYRTVVGTRGMVVSDDALASEWGAEVLRQGGNAVDAAVATAFMLSVTRPQFATLGGGGFLVYCPATPLGQPKSQCQSIDYREMAPTRATRDMFIVGGKARTDLSQNGALASGVPGTPAGLLMALEKFGTFTRQRILSLPIRKANEGVRWSAHAEASAEERWKDFNPAAKELLSCVPTHAGPCPVGTIFRQRDLARVLQEISSNGRDGFYRGWVAQKIASELEAAGGMITLGDLAAYKPKLRAPLSAVYRDHEVITMGPPSAGGSTLLQMLKLSEKADEAKLLQGGPFSTSTIHALVHAMSLAFADRAQFLGDPDFVQVPLDQLLSTNYLNSRWEKSFRSDRANLPQASRQVLGDLQPSAMPNEGLNTTHLSVIDRQGNAVALTTTINDNFGSGFVVAGTGIIMNDEMDDFSIQPGTANLFGLVGSQANEVAAGKRPLSSMTPTLVRDAQGRVNLAIGAQGGPRITTSVFLALVNRIRFGMSIQDAVVLPRFHHQWKPAEILFEHFGFSSDGLEQLQALGYSIKSMTASGRLAAIERFENGRTWGVADPRTEGLAVAE